MAKNADVSNFWHVFLPFLCPLQAIKHHQTIFFCRGGSKLQFGGSYVKIGQELASEMHFISR